VLDLAGELLGRLRDGGLRELEVREGGIRVRVVADPVTSARVEAAGPASAPAPPAVVGERTPPPAADMKSVKAPLTGIFYRSPSPQAAAFVEPGTIVNVGDVIGLIEAMKLFNEVRSTLAGRVLRVLADSGQLVRAHQPLVELE
jgi:acetyl-CoA carboxylase biotin carboxyl carrier protein